ncbi:MAG: response regulator [Cyclobacteriaceae bacterium]
MKILVVEDEIIVADNLCSSLKKLGYDTTDPALNYTQALQRIATEQPDFAILDIHLSGKLDGIDVAQHIKEEHQFPFVFLTAYGDEETLKRAKETLPCGYLLKPYTKSELQPIIEIALLNHKMRQSNVGSTRVLDRLTLAELKIVKRISENRTSKQIAEEYFLSVNTIKNQRHRICSKLELEPTNNALLSWAMANRDLLRDI